MSDPHTKPRNFAVGAFLSVLAIPLAIAAAVFVGLLGTGIAAAVAAIGMFAAFQLFALGSRAPVSRGRDFLFALLIGTTGIIENLSVGRLDLPFPTRAEEVVVPLTIAAVLAILAIIMNAAKALAVHRDNILATANTVATSASNHLETSRTALTSTAKNSANTAHQFANHVMTINSTSPGIVLNGKPLEQSQSTAHFWRDLRETIYKAIRG